MRNAERREPDGGLEPGGGKHVRYRVRWRGSPLNLGAHIYCHEVDISKRQVCVDFYFHTQNPGRLTRTVIDPTSNRLSQYLCRAFAMLYSCVWGAVRKHWSTSKTMYSNASLCVLTVHPVETKATSIQRALWNIDTYFTSQRSLDLGQTLDSDLSFTSDQLQQSSEEYFRCSIIHFSCWWLAAVLFSTLWKTPGDRSVLALNSSDNDLIYPCVCSYLTGLQIRFPVSTANAFESFCVVFYLLSINLVCSEYRCLSSA